MSVDLVPGKVAIFTPQNKCSPRSGRGAFPCQYASTLASGEGKGEEVKTFPIVHLILDPVCLPAGACIFTYWGVSQTHQPISHRY